MVYATVLLIFAANFLDERVLVRDVDHTSGIGEIIFFFIILIYLNNHKNFIKEFNSR